MGVRARGVVSGVVCGVGAVVAHLLAGGTATFGTAWTVMLLSVPLGFLLTPTRHERRRLVTNDVDSSRMRLDPARVGAVALLTQVGWHGVLMLHPGGVGDENTVRMLVAHVIVAALTVLVVTRADHALIAVVGALWTRLFGRPQDGAIVLVRRAPRAMPVVVRASGRRVVSGWTRRGPPSCSAD